MIEWRLCRRKFHCSKC